VIWFAHSGICGQHSGSALCWGYPDRPGAARRNITHTRSVAVSCRVERRNLTQQSDSRGNNDPESARTDVDAEHGTDL
jgi:hypothetical protein